MDSRHSGFNKRGQWVVREPGWKLWVCTGVYWHYLAGVFQYRFSFNSICDHCGKKRRRLPSMCCKDHAINAYRGLLRMSKYSERGFKLSNQKRTDQKTLRMKPISNPMVVHMFIMVMLRYRLIRARRALAVVHGFQTVQL